MDTTTYSFMVIEATTTEPRGHGQFEFRVPPAKGDFITIQDDHGDGQAYEVVVVIHPSSPATTCGDLIIRHAGSDIELRESFQNRQVKTRPIVKE